MSNVGISKRYVVENEDNSMNKNVFRLNENSKACNLISCLHTVVNMFCLSIYIVRQT